MFHPVRVLDGAGRLKKVVTSKRLSKIHWQKFEQEFVREFDNRNQKLRKTSFTDSYEFDDESLGSL